MAEGNEPDKNENVSANSAHLIGDMMSFCCIQIHHGKIMCLKCIKYYMQYEY